MATYSSILAWRIPWTEVTVHGVPKSWTQLSDFHFKSIGKASCDCVCACSVMANYL